ncbi:MAG: DedA family protein [Rhodocyclaceae bacterium]|jgi:membrane-associated protein|nr:DedA family protein [Rhodocyclaceae bacterium]MBK6553961.1 DedA family protein [Rhodocyclaceae bacterium]MBK6678082.1 DedA family protein [Rhodocyclaceae bacterium]MBK7813424.1 DedA family protein [Rhodocyclaceae bacterium]MBK9310761.1 DedA family protein [Rhodocyclaceae bacterium]
MEILGQLVDIVLHLDKHLAALVAQHGVWIYAILFAIIFCETGLVVTPFLPGDSLLFVAGALAATGGMEIGVLIAVLLSAAVIGDNTNYWIGRWFGRKVLHWGEGAPRFFNRDAYDRAHGFYEKFGPATMTIARFIPLVRTFAPFVAGVARMTYPRYFVFDLLGGVIWVVSLTLAGYWFGNLPVVKNNLILVILAIIAISVLPIVVGGLRQRLARRS